MARLGPLRIVIWNVEWAAAGGRKGRTLRERIWDLSPDVVCICEGQEDWAPSDGFLLFPDRPYSPKAKPRCRKVMLWSRRRWHQVDRIGSPDLPPGRFLSATTDTPLGPVGFVGVCVPYEMANVIYGTGTSRNWEDHLRYLGGLAPILADDSRASRTVMLGDFNQRIPAIRAPRRVQDALFVALGTRFRVATAGVLPGLEGQDVDHLAHTDDLHVSGLHGLVKLDADGRKLSDHHGVFVELTPG